LSIDVSEYITQDMIRESVRDDYGTSDSSRAYLSSFVLDLSCVPADVRFPNLKEPSTPGANVKTARW